jgi:ParB family transcriptional regulator, chromosome partitioning protein
MSAMQKNRGLGRGLGALLTDTENVANQAVVEKQLNSIGPSAIQEIAIESIETNPFQPRTHFDDTALNELAESIKVQGIIQPITVRQLGANTYQLISGERRLQASKRAQLKSIPAYIRTANDQQMLEMALIENIQRENLNPLEVALSYQRMIDELSLKQEQLGDRVGKNRSTVTNYLRLLKLPAEIQVALRDQLLSMGHARSLVGVENQTVQLALFAKCIQEGWSVRKLEEAIKAINTPTAPSTPKETATSFNNYKGISDKLSNMFGSKVIINANTEGKGEIKVPFGSEEELLKIVSLFKI